MTSQPFALQPPRLAVWLVDLFTLPDDAEEIMGDLLEEFSQLASKSGVVFAQRWYWRQAVKTIAYLVPTAFSVAPWSTTAGVVGGFLTRRLLGGRTGDLESLSRLTWYFADSLAIVIGAAIVRARRSKATTLPLNP